MNKEIPNKLVDKTIEWLGKEGLQFFAELLCEHGELNVVIGNGPIPHPVHFREGMQVRNFMRESQLCDDWDAHDYDNNWCRLIVMAVIRGKI